jgi:hypothetical protein
MPSSGLEIVLDRGTLRLGVFHYKPPTRVHWATGERWLSAPQGSWQLRILKLAVAWQAAPKRGSTADKTGLTQI